jgi:hypothetical protein
MPKIDSHVTFVKDQVAVQERLARKYDEDDYRKSLHFKTANSFAEIARFLEEIQKRGTQDIAYLNRGDTPLKRIHLTFEEIEHAPDELLQELNLTDTDRQEMLIEYLIAQAGGILSLDKIIVDLYKRTKQVPKRATITSRLYRMAGRGMIYNVPGKKGVYSTYELSEADAKKMFGQFDEVPEESIPAPTPTPTPAAGQGTLTPGERERMKSKLMGSTATSFRKG